MRKINISFLVATFFGLGKFPYMPGTLGSLVAFPIYIILLVISIVAKGGVASAVSWNMTSYMLFINVIIFFIGVITSENYSKDSGKEDPKEVIIDEIAGQLLTIIIIMTCFPYIGEDAVKGFEKLHIAKEKIFYICFIGAFIMFRLFDIFKPWPINYIDKNVKGGFGIMADDICAALMAAVSFFALIFFITDISNKF
jgi:phosphatidylglycerophosphatase A